MLSRALRGFRPRAALLRRARGAAPRLPLRYVAAAFRGRLPGALAVAGPFARGCSPRCDCPVRCPPGRPAATIRPTWGYDSCSAAAILNDVVFRADTHHLNPVT